MYYILDENHNVIEAPDLLEWAEWFEQADRHVACTTGNVTVNGKNVGTVKVSTVFLGLDHRSFGDGPPLVFETMVFGGPLDQEYERCCTWEAAEKMHELMLERVKLAIKEF